MRGARAAQTSTRSGTLWGRRASLYGVNSAFVAERDASAGEVVGRDFDLHSIAGEHADAELSHLAAEGREHGVPVIQRDAECRAGEDVGDGAFEFD